MGLDKKSNNINASTGLSGSHWKKVAIILLAVLVAGGIIYGTYRSITSPSLAMLRAHSKGLNVLLVVVDTCRADHLGCYGYAAAKTHVIDELASSGVQFTRAFSHVPVTLPSHASIMTGTTPVFHGVEDNATFKLPSEATTLAEIMKENGYATGAVVGSFVLHSQYGLDQGFDYYDDSMSPKVSKTGFDEIQAGEVTEKAIAWVQKNKNKKWFLWVHYFDPHFTYRPPPRFGKTLKEPYDGEIAYVDHCIGNLLNVIDNLGMRKRTMVILTSDHGESLGEHGEKTHMIFIYNATMHVPLIISLPNVIPSGMIVDRPVTLSDITPTLMDALGLKGNTIIQGRSLLPLIYNNGPWCDLPVYIESRAPLHQYGWSILQGMQADGYKYIRAPQPELYNLETDPREINNIYNSEPGLVATMSKQFDSLIAEDLEGSLAGNGWVEMDPETEKRLASLGYVWTGPATNRKESLTGKDPKDMIGILTQMNHGEQLMAERKFEEAIIVLEGVLNKSLNNKICLNWLGYIYGQLAENDQKRKHELMEKAITYLRRAIEVDSNFLDAYYNLGVILVSAGRPAEAIPLIQALIEKVPRDARAYDVLGYVYFNLNDFEKSRDLFVKSTELYPNSALAHANLATTYIKLGRWKDAQDQIEIANRLKPENQTYKKMLEGVKKRLKN